MTRNVAMNLVNDEINRKQFNKKWVVTSSSERTRYQQFRTLNREAKESKEVVSNEGDVGILSVLQTLCSCDDDDVTKKQKKFCAKIYEEKGCPPSQPIFIGGLG